MTFLWRHCGLLQLSYVAETGDIPPFGRLKIIPVFSSNVSGTNKSGSCYQSVYELHEDVLTPSYPVSLRSIFILSFHLRLWLPSGLCFMHTACEFVQKRKHTQVVFHNSHFMVKFQLIPHVSALSPPSSDNASRSFSCCRW